MEKKITYLNEKFIENMCRTVLVLLIAFFSSFIYGQTPSVELRGVWIASVANIDWPSSSSLPSKNQKAEIISILDFLSIHHFNTVFVQIRPSADTFYPSRFEPWSKYITGIQGGNPRYNPLKFWIKEAHKRGIEFHAWINPFRITNSKKEKLSKKHPANIHPEWVVTYGGKMYYNPGVPECKKHIENIVEEIVKNYDVDGIHFDDYFYPYPVNSEMFPDSLTYMLYNKHFLNIEDWRRENVNAIIRELNKIIKDVKPTVKFGVSPFGVWRNKRDDRRGSDTNAGVTNYDDLYADVLKWLGKGWIDYVTPQLYWSTVNPAVPFERLTQWWGNNSYGRSVYIGHALYKLNSNKQIWKNPQQMVEQINIVRKNHYSSGSVFFSYRHFMKNEFGFTDSLETSLYRYPSLIPPMAWLDNEIPDAPDLLRLKGNKLYWRCSRSLKLKKNISKYAVYMIKRGGVKQLVLFTQKQKCNISDVVNNEKNVHGFEVTVISKTNNESKGSNIVRFKSK